MVYHEYVSIRKAIRAVSRMQASHVGTLQRSPSQLLQCRQCRIRGKGMIPDMQVECEFFFVEDRSPDKFGVTILNTRGYCACTRDHHSVLYGNYKMCC